MPPKKGGSGADREKKAQNKAKAEKVKQAVADKTFGLKNKNKSKNVQSYVQQMEQSAKAAAARRGVKLDIDGKDAAATRDKKKKDKEAAEAAARELNDLFAVAIKQPKAPPGVDPKSIVCEHYRHGKCTKGFKCKYSHDLNVERKGGKIDLFTDQREADDDEDNMEDWDQEQLEKVIADKHAKEKTNATSIICKHFLDAVERKQYGWFWQCPNGKDCKYRHALPPGYVLKSQMKELLEAEKANKPSIEEEIEAERAKVDARTPITEDSFSMWKERKAAAARKAQEQEQAERRRKGILTGREIFSEEGFVAEDDHGASADYTRENDDEAAAIAERKRWDEKNAALRATQGGAAVQNSSAAGPSGLGASPAQQQNGAAGPSTGAAGSGSGAKAAVEAAALLVEHSDEDDDSDEDFDEDLDALEAELKKKSAID